MKHWTLDDIDWGRFDATKVTPDLVRIIKAAALVEHNGHVYEAYLCNVFAGDAEFQSAARAWAEEEVQHGEALARWAELADPSWSFEASSRRFNDGYKLPVDRVESVRGSRTGELIARCMVETGTSSYYTALAEAAAEPVLQQICRKIAADEFRHYRLFYDHMRRYQSAERLGRLGRLRTGLGRILETEDDELAYAYFAANAGRDDRYERRAWSRAYARQAYGYYRAHHVERGIGMAFKAVGLPSNGRLHRLTWRLAHRFLRWRASSLAAQGA
ncbi:MAG: ferritin-like domain-containing protein [Alphaproteobacteria bacterium]|nr:ferritin-like domain-containing protein [Alphaproteobacteria bacterium]